MMKLPRNKILIEITEADRENIYKKIITGIGGSKIELVTGIFETEENDKFFSETVNMGRVLQVADDCKQVQVDDIVLFDNMIDSEEGIIVDKSIFRKQIVIQESHTYHGRDYLIPPHEKPYKREQKVDKKGNKRGHKAVVIDEVQKRPGYVWRKGDVEDLSHIVGIVRDGKLLCPNTLVITEHHNDDDDIKKYVGIIYDYEKIPVVKRDIRAVAPNSQLKVGQKVLVEREKILNYDFGPYKFDAFFEEDVLMSFDS
jgi:hypothetical protein